MVEALLRRRGETDWDYGMLLGRGPMRKARISRRGGDDVTDNLIVAVFGLCMVGIFLMQLGTWRSRRDWQSLWRRLDEREERRVLRDFILAVEDGLSSEAMGAVYDEACRIIDTPREKP
jgi:hypothetical protein